MQNKTRYPGRLAQIPIYFGKLWRMFIYQSDWKVLPMAAIIAGVVTFAVGEYLFTGDAYIPGVKVVTILPGGDKRTAAASVERIKQLAEGRVVCPGHGNQAPL